MRIRSLADRPILALAVVGGGVAVTVVALGILTRYAHRPVVDALAPVVRGNSGAGFAVGLFSGAAALLMTRWVWHRLWREVRPDDRWPPVVGVIGVAAWFATLVPWAVLMPNVRGGGALSASDRILVDALPGARPGALTGTLGVIALWAALSSRRR